MKQTVRKAVFPVAGLGSRFLPATKANPKEMLPIVDKPLIQYAVEEAVAAGITELIFVTSSSKRAIEDHFDTNYELEAQLESRGKYELLEMVRNVIPEGVCCAYVRQQKPLGLGHAVLCAKPLLNNEPFAVLLADDLIDGAGRGCLSQMIEVLNDSQQSVVAVQKIPMTDTHKYGVVAVADTSNNINLVDAIVEKPAQEDAPSNLGVVGRYVLSPGITEILEATPVGAGGEFQLTDAIAQLTKNEKVYAYQFEGIRYDCGSKLGYLQATFEYGLKHPKVGHAFQEYLSDRYK